MLNTHSSSLPAREGSGQVGEGTTAPIRILVVDDHPVVRFGLIGVLATQPDFQIVGEAGSCAEACAMVARLHPDVLMLDLEMGDAGGADALSRIRDLSPHLPVIIFTAYDNDWRVVEAVKIGLQGYLMKGTAAEHIIEAIRVVGGGGSFLDPRVTSTVMGHVGRTGSRRQSHSGHLTEREKSVLRLLVEGKRNKEISQALFISERTVKYHISGLLAKLQAGNRTEAVKIAVADGLISL